MFINSFLIDAFILILLLIFIQYYVILSLVHVDVLMTRQCLVSEVNFH